MSLSKRIILLRSTGVIALLLICALATPGQQSPNLGRPPVMTIHDQVAAAHQEGKTTVILPPVTESQLITAGVDDFLDDSLVATAELLSRKTYITGTYQNTLVTWYPEADCRRCWRQSPIRADKHARSSGTPSWRTWSISGCRTRRSPCNRWGYCDW
jgi:hypothetical protein